VGGATVRALGADESPMTWVEQLGAAGVGFKPLKHRKFVDRLTDAPAALRAVLALTHDAVRDGRTVSEAAAAAFDHAAAGGGQGGGSPMATIALDYHAFHTSVVPEGAGKKQAPK